MTEQESGVKGVKGNTSESKNINGNQKRIPKPFPDFTIEKSLIIPRAIKEYNAGNPWSPEEIAKTQKISRSNSAFFYLTSASRSYGFTIGTSQAQKIELTALGRDLVYASSQEKEYECINNAFMNIQIFKDVYNYYKGTKLPEKEYLSNTLISQFNLDIQFHDNFIKLYTENLAFLSKYGTKKSASFNDQNMHNDNPKNSNENLNPNDKKVLFVVMPFTEKTDTYPEGFFSEMFNSLIVPAADEAGFFPKTAERSGSDIIHATIVNDILSADLILADLTEHNPNVLFEIGLAIAFEKKVALIRAKGTKQIFDIDNLLRVFDYDSNLWKSTLERDIPNLALHLMNTDKNTGPTYLELLKRN